MTTVAVVVLVAVPLVAAATVYSLRRALLVVTVEGTSMVPTLHPGDRVLVRRTRTVRTGDVAVLGTAGAYRVKRVAAVSGETVPPGVDAVAGALPTVPPDGLVLLGDNPSDSFDSRQAGLFRVHDVIGVVLRPLR
jgi:signal peptidase I